MMDEEFVDLDTVDTIEEEGAYRVVLSRWHIVICTVVLWVTVNEITSKIRWNLLAMQSSETSPASSGYLLGVKLINVICVADFAASSFTLLTLLVYYITSNPTQLEGETKNCYNFGFSLLFSGLFAFVWDMLRYSTLLSLSIRVFPATTACIWTTGIVFVVFLYHTLLPTLSLPSLEVCLLEQRTNEDLVFLILVLFIFTILISKSHAYRRPMVIEKDYRHRNIENCLPRTISVSKAPIHGTVGKPLQYCDGLDISEQDVLDDEDESVQQKLRSRHPSEGLFKIAVILLSFFPMCAVFLVISHVQTLSFDFKLLVVSILQLFLPLLNLLDFISYAHARESTNQIKF